MRPGGRLFIRDLARPDSAQQVESLVERYTGGENEIGCSPQVKTSAGGSSGSFAVGARAVVQGQHHHRAASGEEPGRIAAGVPVFLHVRHGPVVAPGQPCIERRLVPWQRLHLRHSECVQAAGGDLLRQGANSAASGLVDR